MLRRLPSAVAFACLIAAPATAQQPIPGRCTGVLCDLYYSGKAAPAPGQPEAPDPTHLPCHDFVCAAFGGRTPDAPPPAPEPVAAPEQARPVKVARHKTKAHKKVAAADTAKGGEPTEAARGDAVK